MWQIDSVIDRNMESQSRRLLKTANCTDPMQIVEIDFRQIAHAVDEANKKMNETQLLSNVEFGFLLT